MIKVRFKNNYENIYNSKEYTYKDYEGVLPGDIVVVNTSSGYAIAQVSQINVEDYKISPDKLASVKMIVITQKEIQEQEKREYEKRLRMADFLETTKRKNLLKCLSDIAGNTENKYFFETLSTAELEELYLSSIM